MARDTAALTPEIMAMPISLPHKGPYAVEAGSTHITRRRFLEQAGATACAAAWPFQLPDARAEVVRWALVADTHISAAPDKTVRGQNMAANLAQVCREIIQWGPQRVLVAGDMAFDDGLPDDYRAFQQLIKPLRDAPISTHLILGNHDHRENLLHAVGVANNGAVQNKWVAQFRDGPVNWILLDSLKRVDGVSGRLGTAQQKWLQARLDDAPDTPTILCVHHNPEPGLTGLRDTDALLEIATTNRQVKAILFGHTHHFRCWVESGVHLVNLPATGYWFDPTKVLGWIAAEISSHGMSMHLRAVTTTHPLNGTRQYLRWRA